MALIQPTEPPAAAAPRGFALFALGFRPFFLLAGLAALLLVPLWAVLWSSGTGAPGYYGGIAWHAHEMLFGYTVAVVAGFLLTAVRNWTGVDTVTGGGLAALAALWLAGRIMPFLAAPAGLIAAVDLLFVPALAVAIGMPLLRVRSKQPHNLIFIGLLTLLLVGNVLMHLPALGLADTWRAGTDLALGAIVILVAIVAGRVVPFFIERGLQGGVQPRQWRAVEIAAIVTVVAWILAKLFAPGSGWHVAAAGLAAVVHGIRVAAWHVRPLWRVPLLWVLWLGLAWLAVGFLLDALGAAGLVMPSLATHAFTAGTIGVLTLGMMARVSLGHTGRPMRSARAIDVAFGLVNAAAVVRVLLPLIVPGAYAGWIHLSATLWALAFLLFVGVYAPVLWQPRVDGRPG